jgi:predicted short-subunit dehydrogenase-like oxidoreductase (DUF2520 family)
MRQPGKQKIAIAGCGNVAWHLAVKLRLLGYECHVYNHRPNPRLAQFRNKLNCNVHSSLENMIPDAAFYFICVDDKHIGGVARRIRTNNPEAILLHTSGSQKLSLLGHRARARAVFYPLQTFSVNDKVDWKEIPVIIECDDQARARVKKLADQFSNSVVWLDYEQRLKLHLCAVLVNNFTNAFYVEASEFLESVTDDKAGFPLLLPLIKQTTAKLEHMSPLAAQTGPAARGDKGVMKKHLSLLSGEKDLKKIYRQMSRIISRQQKKHEF